METPKDLKYSEEHEWIRVEDNIGVVGITDYAQGELGDVVYVELPEIGKKVNQGEVLGTIEAVKAVSELYSPASGEVIEINHNLEDEPALVNQFPYSDGWLVKIKLSNPDELSNLMDESGYKEMIGA